MDVEGRGEGGEVCLAGLGGCTGGWMERNSVRGVPSQIHFYLSCLQAQTVPITG